MANPNPSPATRFKPVNNGGGRGNALSGRAKAFRLLDEILGEEENLDRLRDGLQKAFDRNPVGFFIKIVMPLLLRDAKLNLNEDGPREIIWHPIADTPRTRNPGQSEAVS